MKENQKVPTGDYFHSKTGSFHFKAQSDHSNTQLVFGILQQNKIGN
jgi:hypothetical protein